MWWNKDTSKRYYELHHGCPKCGEIPNKQTYMGMINPSDKNPDYNRCVCDCGWSGEVHDLVSKRCASLLKRILRKK